MQTYPSIGEAIGHAMAYNARLAAEAARARAAEDEQHRKADDPGPAPATSDGDR